MPLLAALSMLLFAGTVLGAEEAPAADGMEFRPVQDLGRAVSVFAQDAWHIYTFPRHLDGNDWLLLGGVLTATGLLYAYDQEILDAVQRNEDSLLMAPLREVGDFVEPAGHMGNTNFWYLSGLAVSYTAGWERPTRIFAQILESHYIAGLGKNTVQYFVGRTRPHEGFGPREFGRDDATSFPSGHSSNIFQVATVLSHHVDNRWFDIAAYGTAGTVALQRIRSNAHWPSDVLLSSFYGWAVAKTVVKRHEERTAAGAGGMALEPHISPLGTGVQVAWRF